MYFPRNFLWFYRIFTVYIYTCRISKTWVLLDFMLRRRSVWCMRFSDILLDWLEECGENRFIDLGTTFFYLASSENWDYELRNACDATVACIFWGVGTLQVATATCNCNLGSYLCKLSSICDKTEGHQIKEMITKLWTLIHYFNLIHRVKSTAQGKTKKLPTGKHIII
jgi:hypothetical protein